MDPLTPSTARGGIALNDYQLSDPLIWILPIVKERTRDATNCRQKTKCGWLSMMLAVFGSSHTCDVLVCTEQCINTTRGEYSSKYIYKQLNLWKIYIFSILITYKNPNEWRKKNIYPWDGEAREDKPTVHWDRKRKEEEGWCCVLCWKEVRVTAARPGCISLQPPATSQAATGPMSILSLCQLGPPQPPPLLPFLPSFCSVFAAKIYFCQEVVASCFPKRRWQAHYAKMCTKSSKKTLPKMLRETLVGPLLDSEMPYPL